MREICVEKKFFSSSIVVRNKLVDVAFESTPNLPLVTFSGFTPIYFYKIFSCTTEHEIGKDLELPLPTGQHHLDQ